MKKILALILAVLMIAAVAVSMVSAADEDYPKLDVGDMRYYGQDNTYLGDTPIANAPVIDGTVNTNEYQQEFVIYKDGDAKKEYVGDNKTLENDIHEYYAYDANNFYIALVLPSDNAKNLLALNLNAIDSPSPTCYTPRTQLLFYDPATMETPAGIFTKNNGNTPIITTAGHAICSRGFAVNIEFAAWREGKKIPSGTKVVIESLDPDECEVQSKYDATNKLITYEIKVSKKTLAASWRTAGRDAANEIKRIAIYYEFVQKYNSATNYATRTSNTSYILRKWYPQTTEDGFRADYVLADAELRGGTYCHFVYATSAPAIVVPETKPYDDDLSGFFDQITEAPETTAAPATAAPETTAEDANKGCGGSLTVSALALLPVVAGGVVIARKRED